MRVSLTLIVEVDEAIMRKRFGNDIDTTSKMVHDLEHGADGGVRCKEGVLHVVTQGRVLGNAQGRGILEDA